MVPNGEEHVTTGRPVTTAAIDGSLNDRVGHDTEANGTEVGRSLTRRAVAGTAWSTVATVARQFLSLACVAVLARALGPDAYGIMAMAATFTQLLVNIRDMGTATAIIQRSSVSNRLLSSLFWVNCALGIGLTLLLFALSGPAAEFFRDPRVKPVLQAISPSFLLTSLGAVHNAILSRRMAFRQLAIADVISAVVGYTVAVVCALTGFGVWSLVLGQLVLCGVTTIMSWLFARWIPSFEIAIDDLHSISGFSLNLSGFVIVNYFARNSDNLIVGRTLGNVALGYYQMAYNLMLYPLQNISAVVSQVLLPAFSKISQDDERFRSAYVRACGLIALVTFPVIAGLGVVADPFVRAVLGPKWIGSIIIFQILAPVGLMQSIQTTIGHIYIAKGRTDWMFRWGLYATCACVCAFLIGIRWGTVGVAFAYAIVYFVCILIPGFYFPFRLIGLRLGEFARYMGPQFGITALMVLVSALILNGMALLARVSNPWMLLIVTSVGGAVTYCAAFLIIRPVVFDDAIEVLENSHPAMERATRMFARPILRPEANHHGLPSPRHSIDSRSLR